MDQTDFGSVDRYYKSIYSRMVGIESTGLMSLMWKYPHKLMEKPFSGRYFEKILEVGAGGGEHLIAASIKCTQ